MSIKTNTNITLTKDSSVLSIKAYFEAINELYDKHGMAFCVDFDTVWQLAYSHKRSALDSLIVVSTQDVDFQISRQNPQKPNSHNNGGRPTEKYMLTVPTLEWFIARRVPAVFEVYRQVFHAVRKQAAALPIINQELVEKVGYPVLIDGKLFYSYRRVLRAAGYTARLTRFYKKATAECVTPQLFGDGGASHYRYANGEWLCSDRVYVARRREKMAWNRFIAERKTALC